MIFYCICDGVNTAARVWFVFHEMGEIEDAYWVGGDDGICCSEPT